VQIPKHEIFVKQSTKSFEESFDMALDAVLIKIKKVKEKQAV
jgi:putative sigma-54 modulation protein